MDIFFLLAPSYVRLRNSSFHDGIVQAYHQGAWGQVCREGWNEADAKVACRELGFETALPGGNEGTVFQFYENNHCY